MGGESLSLMKRNETSNNRSTGSYARGVWGCRNFPVLPWLNAYADRDTRTYADASPSDSDPSTYADASPYRL